MNTRTKAYIIKARNWLEGAATVAAAIAGVRSRSLTGFIFVGTVIASEVSKVLARDTESKHMFYLPRKITRRVEELLRKYPTYDTEYEQVSEVRDTCFHIDKEGDGYIRTTGDITAAKRIVGDLLWADLGDRIEIASGAREDVDVRSGREGSILPSEQGDKIMERLEKFRSAGHSRCILLHGTPGTGKTTMTRYVASRLEGRVVSVLPCALVDLGFSGVESILECLCPDITIVDDIDRVPNGHIAFLEAVRGSSDVCLLTANHLDWMDEAEVRTGRVDEFEEVVSVVEPSFVISISDPEIMTELEDWPIADLIDLQKRIDVLGEGALRDEMNAMTNKRKSVEGNVKKPGSPKDRESK